MKPIIVKIYLAGLFCLALLIAACEKDASDDNFGDPLVYMPQAKIAALRYAVPNTGVGLDSVTKNYQVIGDSVRILLGVARSGSEPGSSFSVEVFALNDTVTQLISTGVFPAPASVLLPAAAYSIPASVAVPASRPDIPFYLSIDRAKLKTYAGKTVLLAIGIRNPSKYKLNTEINKVIVVIAPSSLNL